jgi:hypothetical protein
MAWNGAGAWLIFSQSRQLNFSRTVSITFHWRGITSSVRVTSMKKAWLWAYARDDRPFGGSTVSVRHRPQLG